MQNNPNFKAYQSGGSGGAPNIPEPGNPTYTEAWALIEAARRMAAAIQYGNMEKTEDKKRLRDAIRLNWRLWTIFQAELTVGASQEANEMPEGLRMDMLTLCKFVDNHTIGLMTEPTAEKVATLIDLNRNIAQGLLSSLEDKSGQDSSSAAAAKGDNKAEPASISEDI